MEKRYCKRCNATKAVEEFNDINKYSLRCLEKEREKHRKNKDKEKVRWQNYYANKRDEILEKQREYAKTYRQLIFANALLKNADCLNI